MVRFPSFKRAKRVAIDLETVDPDLKTKGIGVRRGGYVVGYAIAYNDRSYYFPVAHDVGKNYDLKTVESWLRDELAHFKGEAVFANGLYDLDYMAERGIHVPERVTIRDIQIAEPLIDDNSFTYNLDRLAWKYLGHGKNEDALRKTYGAKYKQNMNVVDPRLAADYAKDDAADTLAIYERQVDALTDVWNVFELESALTPMLLYMRRLGVRVDLKRTDELSNRFYTDQKRLETKLRRATGIPFGKGATVWQNDALGKAFNALDLDFPLSPTGKPSFRKAWLEQHDHEIAQLIVDIRNLDKLRGTFLASAIAGNHVDGRIHTTFNQVRNDEGGAVTGRFSSCHPNLQQVPSRDKYLAPLIRGLFLPERGHHWGCVDYSQIEYRLLVHYAFARKEQGAKRVIDQYADDPRTDYHALIQALIHDMTGHLLDRKAIKNINFGLIYGMGKKKLARMLGVSIEETEEILFAYNQAIPFATAMRQYVSDAAERRGYVRTLLGRYRRFPRWESIHFETSQLEGAFEKSEARERYGNRIKRAWVYKALNALIQGAAADVMKKAMLDIWRSGITTAHGGPIAVHLTVHDELDFSFPKNKAGRDAFREVIRIMEQTVDLSIPLIADGGFGANWAKASED